MKNLTPFGKAVRKYRIDRGETQLEIATAVGVSVAFWSAIETGKKNVPPQVLNKLIAHFEVCGDEETALRRLAWVSQKEFKITTQGLSDRSRTLAACFARKFSTLNDEQLQKLGEILNEGQCSDDEQ